MIIAICILAVLLIVSIFININLLRKIEKVDDELEDVSLTVEDLISTIRQAYQTIKTADSRGSFESDDEVGSVFKQIKSVITNLDSKYDLENEK